MSKFKGELDADTSASLINEAKTVLWGSDVKHDVFRRWTQGFLFSPDECTALLQQEGGPCAVIAPVQAFFIKNLIFGQVSCDEWRHISDAQRSEVFLQALEDIFRLTQSTDSYSLVYLQPEEVDGEMNEGPSDANDQSCDEGTSSPKKQCFSHEQFHARLRCRQCEGAGELHNQLREVAGALREQYGVLLLLYSLVLTKGIEQLRNEVEDVSQPLIDGTYGHGSQSLINLVLTGRAVSNVWDNDKDIEGLKLCGISKRSTIGFLTLLEHLRYCEVGWYLKNPEYPIWLLGSETHLTVLFSLDSSLVGTESPDAAARRMFSTYDTEGSGFISADLLGDLLGALDLVSEPEYVKIMQERLDPEQLGIITLNGFLDEFFPAAAPAGSAQAAFTLYHYNGLARSCPDNKVAYLSGEAAVHETEELQLVEDVTPLSTCLTTKWPTIQLKWRQQPSLN